MINRLLALVDIAYAAIKIILTGLVALAVAMLGTLSAHADGGGARVPMPNAYTQECTACHVAYPPGMLPAPSWTRIMGNLKQHYGTDASLDAATVRELAGWLTAHSGTYKGMSAPPPEDRITRSAWFEREHRKIDPQVWKLASVKSATNCAACHSQADQGDFRERNLRYPTGLDARYRKAWD